VAGADAEDRAAAGDDVQRRDVRGEQHRLAYAGVRDVRRELDPGSDRGGRGEGDVRSGARAGMVGDVEGIEAGRFGTPGGIRPFGGVLRWTCSEKVTIP
jgi:hypothetical protein